MTAPTFLITRPMPQALHTAAEYTAQGWRCILSPAIITEPLPEAVARMAALDKSSDAWVVTSGVALGVLAEYYNNGYSSARWSPAKNNNDVATWTPACAGVRDTKPLFVTGEVLAAQARAAGFSQVQQGEGSAQGLLDVMIHHANPTWRYGYLHSNHQSMPLVERLQAQGRQAQGAEIYHSHPAHALSPQAVHALQAGEVQAISFYSSMTARAFLVLAAQAGVISCLKEVQAWCYSENIARAIPEGLFSEVIVL